MKELLSAGIKVKELLKLFLLILIIGSSVNDLFSQNIQTKPTRQSSFEAFSKGNYELAYSEFKELLLIYAKDPLYKYYSGVCLVKLNRNPGEAVTLLQQALQGAAVVKSLPSDALFYLGRSQQMSGKFVEAVESFNLFTEQVGKKAAREQSVPEFIKQCNDKTGKLAEPEIKQTEIANNETVDVSKPDNKPVVKELNLKPVLKEAAAKQNLLKGSDQILDEAIDFQIKADSLNVIVSVQKKELEKLTNNEKPALRMKISENELLASSFQKSADQKYDEAQRTMNPQHERIPPDEGVKPADKMVIKNSVQQSDLKTVKETYKQPDTVRKVVPVVRKPVETFVLFEVLPKPVSDPKEKITIDSEAPAGLIYRIQIAVFRNPVAPVYFKGISPVYGIKLTGTDKTNYYAGMFRRSSDAKKALAAVKAKGFKDAFVVALSGNKSVSSDRAAILEKEWGKKPFLIINKSVAGTSIDTIPPTLSYRVEVTRSLKPLKDDLVEGIKKMAGIRGLDMQPIYDGNIAYLIGKFITFESAAEYADLLIRNGYREARVVAWLGKKEIPVETAKQLFDNLE